MRKTLSLGGAAVALVLAVGSAAQAAPVTISIQASEDGGTPFSVTANGSDGSYTYTNPTFGSPDYTFSGTIMGTPNLTPQPALDTTSVDVQRFFTSSGDHTLAIWITESNLTQPTGVTSFVSGFTTNTWQHGVESVTENVFVSTSDQFGGTLVGSHTFDAGTGVTVTQSNPINLTGTYAETIEYLIDTDDPRAASNNSVDVTVAEPGTLAVLGAGLAALGVATLRRRGRSPTHAAAA